MNQVLFEELFAEMAEKFNIAKLCRDNNKEYDLQSMMIALSGKVCCSQEPIDEDKLDELAEEYNSKQIFEDEFEELRSKMSFKAGYRKAMEG